MGLFSKLVSKVWGFAKRVASKTWHGVVKPAAQAVARFLGIQQEKVDRATAAVERTAAQVVQVLEANVGDLIRQALDELQLRFERWAIAHLGAVGVMLVAAIERVEALMTGRPRTAPVTVDQQVVPIRTSGPKVGA